jgi:hypothetical protein
VVLQQDTRQKYTHHTTLKEYTAHKATQPTTHMNTTQKGNVILVTGRGGLYGCEMLRIPHCLDSRPTDGGKVVSPTHRRRSTPQKHYFSVCGSHFCSRLSEPQGLVWPEGLGQLKKCIHLMGSRTRDLPACGIQPWPWSCTFG